MSLVLAGAIGFLGPCLSTTHVLALNPVMTLSMVFSGKVGMFQAPLAMIGQLLGSLVGIVVGRAVTPNEVVEAGSLCSLVRDGMPAGKALALQLVLSSVLFFSLANLFGDRRLSVTRWHQAYGVATLAVTLSGAAWIGLPANPLLPLAAAVYEGCWANQWVHWVGALLGSLVAAVLQRGFMATNKSQGSFTPSMISRRTSLSLE